MTNLHQFCVPGTLINFNTIENFNSADREKLLSAHAQTIRDAVETKWVERSPELLYSFLLLSFADLKKYHFHYWYVTNCHIVALVGVHI